MCWLTVGDVSQLSFFSAESVPAAVTDLTGLLAAPGQIVVVGAGARLSVVVDRPWRATALAEMIAAAGLTPEIGRTDEDTRWCAPPWTRGCALLPRPDPRGRQNGAAVVGAGRA